MLPPERTYYSPLQEGNHEVTFGKLDPTEYLGLVQTINENTQNFYKKVLKDAKIGGDACIVVVGSDGKCERHAQSRTEFVLILKELDDRGPRDQVMNVLLANQDKIHLELGPHRNIEVKIVNGTIPVSWVYNNDQSIYPDRILNCGMIMGNYDVLRAIRGRVISEMIDEGKVGKGVRERIRDQLREYRKTIRTGIFRGYLNFDPINGVQYYCENQPIQLGFKPGYIRVVQRKFDLAVALGIGQGYLTFEDVLDNLPSTTVDKFSFFASRRLLDHHAADETACSYAWFLQQYHHAQEHVKTLQRPVTVSANKDLFNYHAHVINNFVETAFK